MDQQYNDRLERSWSRDKKLKDKDKKKKKKYDDRSRSLSPKKKKNSQKDRQYMRDKDKDRDKQKQRSRQRQRQKQRQRYGERQRQRQKQGDFEKEYYKDKYRDRSKQKHKDKYKDKQREKDREKEKEKDRDRQRQRQKERDKDRDRDRQRQKQRQKERDKDKQKDREKQRLKQKQRDKIKDKQKGRDMSKQVDNGKEQAKDIVQPMIQSDQKKLVQRQKSEKKKKKRSRQRSQSQKQKKSRKQKRSYDRSRSRDKKKKKKDYKQEYEKRRRRDSSSAGHEEGHVSDDPEQVQKLAQMKAAKQLVSSKADRKLYLGNLPPNITSQQLMDMLNGALKKMEINTQTEGDSIVSAWISPEGVGHYAFVEFRTAQQATNGLTLNGASLFGYQLKLGRPKQYIQYNKTLLSQMGTDRNLESILKKVAALGPDQLPLVQERIVCPPSKIIVLKYIVSIEELAIDEEFQEILEDVRDMAKRFGQVVNIVIPRPHQIINLEEAPKRVKGLGLIFVEYIGVNEAKFARSQFVTKQFSGQPVACSFFDEELFQRGQYDLNQKVVIEF